MTTRRSFLTAVALAAPAAAQQQPFPVHDTKPVIINGPYLLAPTEDSVTIVWITDTPCHSKVVFGVDALDREADNAVDGLLPIGQLHAVRVRGLEPGKTYRYKAASTRVVKMKSYWPEKGLSAETAERTFTTFDRRKESFSFALITDTHEDLQRIAALLKLVDWPSTDFLVHLGDAFHGIESEDAIWDKFLTPVGRALGGTKPLLYVRGNHEARGPAARALRNHLPIPEERFYYARDHGPVHFVALDTGEDKPDDTNVYARLNAFQQYRETELKWLAGHIKTDRRMQAAPFRVLLMHSPSWGWVDDQASKWREVANSGRFDLAVSGHTHRFSHTTPSQNGNTWHQVVLSPDQVARVDASATEIVVTVRARDGNIVETFSIGKAAYR
jgi:predicted phosphodiesterase